MKTIDVNAKEWFDRVNGNSYFSARVTVDYGLKTEKSYVLPFRGGYGDHYIDTANCYLSGKNIIDNPRHENGTRLALWRYCKENNIILRTSKETECLKRDVLAYGVE